MSTEQQAVAYLHTLSVDGGREHKRLTFDRAWPFDDVSGVAGSTSTAELVFRTRPQPAPVAGEAVLSAIIHEVGQAKMGLGYPHPSHARLKKAMEIARDARADLAQDRASIPKEK